MIINDWKLRKARYDKKEDSFCSFAPVFSRELYSYIKRVCNKEGIVIKLDEVPVLTTQTEKGILMHIPIRRFIGNHVQDFNGKLYKVNGLETKYTLAQKIKRLSLINPYQNKIMQGFSAAGNRHSINEDAYTCINHPKSDNIKLLVVADGMGGAEAGWKASRMLVELMINWFDKTDVRYLEDSNWVYSNMSKIINIMNDEINEELIINQRLNTGTTLACAIINSNHMIYANVGDSRICALQNGQLKLISVDDTPNWRVGEVMTLEKLEIIRTLPNNNYITAHIGGPSVIPNVGYLSNKDYTDVFLFSDGVTDCISYSELDKIAKNIDKKTLFEFIEKSSYGENTPGAKKKGSDDRTVVHYGVRR